MNITIHQGATTLGGNCVEIQSGDHSILIDAGIPVNTDSLLSPEKFKRIADRAAAIFISHPHPDHYEMLAWLEKDIPVYMSRGCKKIIGIAHHFGQLKYNPAPARTFNKETISIPGSDITVKPIAVDHSGFDSRAFLISAGEQNILYSGDLRDHGRKKYLADRLPDQLPDTINTLILEGTLLTREYTGIPSEQEVENELTKVFKESKRLCLIAFSSQNIDRLVSVYKACLRTKRTLVIDPYTALILQELKPISENLPQYFWNYIGILFSADSYTRTIEQTQLYRFANAKITKKMIRENPENYALKSNRYVELRFKKGELPDDPTLIYSVWKGYADGIWKQDNVNHIHCSGHAKIETLEKMIQDLSPDKLIPIHTEDASIFEQMDLNGTKLVKK